MNKLLKILFIPFILVTFAACSEQAAENSKPAGQSETKSVNKQESKVEITISKYDKKNLKSRTIEIEKDAILMNVLKENFDIEEKDGFITSIDGIHAEKGKENKYGWVYEVNGKMPTVGAADYKLKPGDKVSFEFQQFK